MQVVRTKAEMVEQAERLRAAGERIALVPTMGFLHDAHLALVQQASDESTSCIVSLFVNPKQFNVKSDLESYPRDEERDLELLQKEGVAIVFAPSVEEIYPEGHVSTVQVSELTEQFEGAGRPGHFDGVATVLTILFNTIKPHLAVFGEKDFQQLRVVERLVHDLGFPIDILRGPLVREDDGVAMSSRNVRLSPEGRASARGLSTALRKALEVFQSGAKEAEEILGAAKETLAEYPGVDVEYLQLVSEEWLQPVERVADRPTRILLTAYVEGVRLLDNMPLR